jgi:hypothetical protein
MAAAEPDTFLTMTSDRPARNRRPGPATGLIATACFIVVLGAISVVLSVREHGPGGLVTLVPLALWVTVTVGLLRGRNVAWAFSVIARALLLVGAFAGGPTGLLIAAPLLGFGLAPTTRSWFAPTSPRRSHDSIRPAGVLKAFVFYALLVVVVLVFSGIVANL